MADVSLVIRASEPPPPPPGPDRVKGMGKFSNDSFCQKCPNRVSTAREGENSHQLHLGFRSTVKEASKAHTEKWKNDTSKMRRMSTC